MVSVEYCSSGSQCPIRDLWQYLVTFSVGGTTGVSWVEGRDATKHPKMYKIVPTKNDPAQMSVALRLRNNK